MKEGWEVRELGEIASVEYGFTGKSFTEGDYRYVRITDINNNGELTDSNKKYLLGTKENENFLLEDKDLLMARTGATFAKVLLYKDTEPSVFASYLVRIKFKVEIINKLYWYFSKSYSYWEQANNLSSGAAQPHFNGAALKKVIFSYPNSLTEQKQIVAILDKAFAAIDRAKANIEKNIENAKELFQSKLNEVFSQKGEGWEEKRLGEVCEKTKNIKWKEHKNEEYKYIDLSSVSRETLEITETTNVNDKNAPSRAKKIIEKGDVIFATTRPTLKRATIINEELDNQICSTGYVVLRPKESISTEWIFFYLLTSNFMDRMESLQRGASYPAVSDSDVKGSILSIPKSKIIENENILIMREIREGTNQIVLQYQDKSKALDDLKKSLLEKAFSGALSEAGLAGLEDKEDLSIAAEPQALYTASNTGNKK